MHISGEIVHEVISIKMLVNFMCTYVKSITSFESKTIQLECEKVKQWQEIDADLEVRVTCILIWAQVQSTKISFIQWSKASYLV